MFGTRTCTTTFPFPSMMEWTVVYRADLAGGKQTRETSGMAYIHPSGNAEKRCGFFKPLLFVLCRETERFRVNHAGKVVVHMFREVFRIKILDCLSPLEKEFHLIRA